jgi:hypothetical protein
LSLKVLNEAVVYKESPFLKNIIDIYEKMGDVISMQYGGSIAHHASIGNKKNINKVKELKTSFLRFVNNSLHDN